MKQKKEWGIEDSTERNIAQNNTERGKIIFVDRKPKEKEEKRKKRWEQKENWKKERKKRMIQEKKKKEW